MPLLPASPACRCCAPGAAAACGSFSAVRCCFSTPLPVLASFFRPSANCPHMRAIKILSSFLSTAQSAHGQLWQTFLFRPLLRTLDSFRWVAAGNAAGLLGSAGALAARTGRSTTPPTIQLSSSGSSVAASSATPAVGVNCSQCLAHGHVGLRWHANMHPTLVICLLWHCMLCDSGLCRGPSALANVFEGCCRPHLLGCELCLWCMQA